MRTSRYAQVECTMDHRSIYIENGIFSIFKFGIEAESGFALMI
jgi:hypothetical protein